MHIQKIHLAMVMSIILVFIVGFSFGCKSKKSEEAKTMTQLVKLPDIKESLAKYSPTEMTFDKTRLSSEDTQVLEKLVLAAKGIDTIFWKQAYPPGLALKAKLERSADPSDKDYLRFLKINFGPFDRQDENKPFIGTSQKPAGAGFYPPDLTKQEFENYVAQHPEIKESFESAFTVIKREKGKLMAVPYNIEYKEDLEPIARCLREAAELTTNDSLKKYLSRRAQDLLANNYYQSDCDWIELKDNLVEIVIGPYEVYEDSLSGLKASYESYVYFNDREEMKKIKGYLSFLDEMQKNLPVEQKYKDQKVGGLESPLNVVIEVFTAGDAKAGIQTSAFVLPNDEKVREKKGTKKVFLKNVMEAKFNKSLLPISERVLSAEDAKLVSFDAYFNETILHEICHALGVNYVTLPDGTKTTVNKALKDLNSAIEEAKADIVGLYHVPFLIEKGWFPAGKEKEAYTTYLAGIFRALRFGATEAHGLGTLLQFNFLKEKEAFLYDPASGKYKVNFAKIKDAVKDLAKEFLVLEGNGNYEDAKKFIARFGQMDDLTQQTIQKLKDIPVDIEPLFEF
jgi:hypothetical protein